MTVRRSFRRALQFVATRAFPEIVAQTAAQLFESPTLYPTQPEELQTLARSRAFRVDFEGGTLAAWERRGGKDASTILFVHGWSSRGSQFYALIDALHAEGFTVVTFDAPAHGQSTTVAPRPSTLRFHLANRLGQCLGWETSDRETNVTQYMRALREMAALTGARAIVAHSLGATATALALGGGLALEKIVLLGPPAEARKYLRNYARSLKLDDAIAERMERRIARNLGLEWDEIALAQIAPRLRTPMLLIADENDRDVPIADARKVAEAWPGAELVVTRGYGHRRLLRAPEAIAATREFLRDLKT